MDIVLNNSQAIKPSAKYLSHGLYLYEVMSWVIIEEIV